MPTKRRSPINTDHDLSQSGQTPAPVDKASDPAAQSSASDVADFVRKMKSVAPPVSGERGRLIFAMDATMSRQPTWDMALGLQGEMFQAVGEVGGLDVQLAYYRGFGECRASKWVSNPNALARLMTQVGCQGGRTQIGKILTHARSEFEMRPVNALVFVGDAMEESVDDLCHKAGELSLLGVPVFIFQEGYDLVAENAFKEITRLTKGAWCRFDAGSAAQLKDLLTAVAVYAAGGRSALQALGTRDGGAGARKLLAQLPAQGRR